MMKFMMCGVLLFVGGVMIFVGFMMVVFSRLFFVYFVCLGFCLGNDNLYIMYNNLCGCLI